MKYFLDKQEVSLNSLTRILKAGTMLLSVTDIKEDEIHFCLTPIILCD